MINENRLKKLFLKLVAFDSESYSEKEIGKYVTGKLLNLGLQVDTENTTKETYLKEHPDSHPNIYAFFKGNIPGEPILFTAHLDTVSPGINKKPVDTKDGFITSQGDTVLGADDVSGISSIIEAISVIKEKNLDHPDIEILFTVAEEVFGIGSVNFNYDLIRSKIGYALDLTGPIGSSAICAPSIVSFQAIITGRAAHAGFAPEDGINALNAAAQALNHIKTGRVDEDTTVNVGTIEGGTARNIVPEKIKLSGEVRSLDHEKALKQINEIKEVFRKYSSEAGATLDFSFTEHVKAYNVSKDEEVVKRFLKTAKQTGLDPELMITLGGSDANVLNEFGITTIVNACGMEKVHSTKEYVYLKDLYWSAELTLNLMTYKDGSLS